MTDQEVATAEALRAEYERLEQAHADADELSDHVDRRLGEIETELAALDDRPVRYDPDEIARAGVFVSIDSLGRPANRARLCAARRRAPLFLHQCDSTQEEADPVVTEAATR